PTVSLSLHDALPIYPGSSAASGAMSMPAAVPGMGPTGSVPNLGGAAPMTPVGAPGAMPFAGFPGPGGATPGDQQYQAVTQSDGTDRKSTRLNSSHVK